MRLNARLSHKTLGTGRSVRKFASAAKHVHTRHTTTTDIYMPKPFRFVLFESFVVKFLHSCTIAAQVSWYYLLEKVESLRYKILSNR